MSSLKWQKKNKNPDKNIRQTYISYNRFRYNDDFLYLLLVAFPILLLSIYACFTCIENIALKIFCLSLITLIIAMFFLSGFNVRFHQRRNYSITGDRQTINKIPRKKYIETTYGVCECKLTYKNYKPIIILSFDKVQKHIIMKDDIFKFFKIHQTKYNKSIIIRGNKENIFNIFSALENGYGNIRQFNSSSNAIKDLLEKNKGLSIEYIDREEEDDIKKVEINSAGLIKLAKVPFISIVDANKIKNRIKEYGEFQNLWQFAEFMNLEQNQIDILIKYVSVKPTDKNKTLKQPEIKLDNLLDI